MRTTSRGMSPPPSSLAFLAATSSGNQSGAVTLTVTYRAPPEHTTVWEYMYAGNINTPREWYTLMKSAGSRTRVNDNTYTSSLTIPSNLMKDFYYVELYAGNDTAMVGLYTRFAVTKTELAIPAVKPPFSDMSFSHVVLDDEDLDITFSLNEGFITSNVLYTGLDMSGETAEVISASRYFSPDVLTERSHPGANGMKTSVVTIKQPYAAQGGFLGIRCYNVEQDQNWESFVPLVSTGYVVTILPTVRQSIIPENTVWVSSWTNITSVYGPLYSLRCKVMGKPVPNVGIYKELEDRSLEEVPTESLVFQGGRITKVVHVLNSYKGDIAGNYICRAESGAAVADKRCYNGLW